MTGSTTDQPAPITLRDLFAAHSADMWLAGTIIREHPDLADAVFDTLVRHLAGGRRGGAR